MSQISISKKSYLTSLRNRLKQLYEAQESGYTDINEDWINGFMAAGYHSGLVTLSELKLEHMSAYREVSKKIMSEEGEAELAVRLTRLCKPEAGTNAEEISGVQRRKNNKSIAVNSSTIKYRQGISPSCKSLIHNLHPSCQLTQIGFEG